MAEVMGEGTSVPHHPQKIALILAANMVDLIPNATLTSVTWVTAGALAGWAVRRETVDAGSAAASPRHTGPAPLRVILS